MVLVVYDLRNNLETAQTKAATHRLNCCLPVKDRLRIL